MGDFINLVHYPGWFVGRLSSLKLGYRTTSPLSGPIYGLNEITFATIAAREDTPILIMMSRRKVFTVLGLTSIRFAISLLLKPCSKYCNVSRSRLVR